MDRRHSSFGVSDNTTSSLKAYAALNQDVTIFDYGNVVVRKNYKEEDRVRLVSGGSTQQTEYVGKGMLIAAIQGIQNMSPTPNVILRTIRELSVNHVKGVLIIVPASSTDVLNFGLAVERAVNDDLRVMFLGVADDCKNTEYPKTKTRGLSGVILVNKIAGALSEMGKSMPHIYEYCEKVLENISSCATNISKLGVNGDCSICNKCTTKTIKIENQKRTKTVTNFTPQISKHLVTEICKDKNFILNPGEMVVLLVNNIAGVNMNEKYNFVEETLAYFTSIEVNVARFYISSFLSFNFDIDFSITILKVFDKELLNYLDAPSNAPGWQAVNQSGSFLVLDNVISGCLKRKCRLSPPIKGPKLRDRPSNVLQLCLQFACDALISCEKMLNKIDSEIGDGDTGTRLRYLSEVVNKRICAKKLDLVYPFTFFLSLSKIIENSIGGTMGCIYSIIFEAAANKFGEHKEDEEVSPMLWLEALENACRAVKRYGNVDEGDNTMYDPMQACALTVRRNLLENPSKFITAFGLGVSKAEESAQSTKGLGNKFPDPGAHAVGIWMRAVYEGIKLRCDEREV